MFSALGERTRRKSGNEVELGLTLTRTVAILKMSSLFDIARYSDQRGARKVRPVLHCAPSMGAILEVRVLP